MDLSKYLIPVMESELIGSTDTEKYIYSKVDSLRKKFNITEPMLNYAISQLRGFAKRFPPDQINVFDRIYEMFNNITPKSAKVILINGTGMDNISSPMQSKFGGVPYMEKAPNNEDDVFTCQVNFSELPNIGQYPRKGIIQLWTPYTSGDPYTVYYRNPKLEAHKSEMAISHSQRTNELHTDIYDHDIYKGIGMKFNVSEENINYHEMKDINRRYKYKSLEYNISEILLEILDNPQDQSKMNGMDNPIQIDRSAYVKDTRLLLEISSSHESGINYGDCGNYQVYIKESDLKRGNLENTRVYASCY